MELRRDGEAEDRILDSAGKETDADSYAYTSHYTDADSPAGCHTDTSSRGYAYATTRYYTGPEASADRTDELADSCVADQWTYVC